MAVKTCGNLAIQETTKQIEVARCRERGDSPHNRGDEQDGQGEADQCKGKCQ